MTVFHREHNRSGIIACFFLIHPLDLRGKLQAGNKEIFITGEALQHRCPISAQFSQSLILWLTLCFSHSYRCV
jgi:hypothetical protein